jgi:hypothetical protein
MNSNQRRKLNRKYPYSISIKYSSGLRYFEWDDRVILMRTWCNKFARKGWTIKTRFDSSEFSFAQDQDRTLFILRWA